MKRITHAVHNGVDAVSIVLLGLLCLDVFVGVVDRYLFKTGMAWTEEMARFLLIWLSLLSAVLATWHSRHFRITLVVDLFPAAVTRTILLLMNLLTIATLGAVLVWGIQVTAVVSQQNSAAMELPLNWIYVSLPISLAAIILFLVDETIDMMRSGGPSSTELPAQALIEE